MEDTSLPLSMCRSVGRGFGPAAGLLAGACNPKYSNPPAPAAKQAAEPKLCPTSSGVPALRAITRRRIHHSRRPPPLQRAVRPRFANPGEVIRGNPRRRRSLSGNFLPSIAQRPQQRFHFSERPIRLSDVGVREPFPHVGIKPAQVDRNVSALLA